MKKLVAISVLFVILAAAVFAQDDEGKWKVGFKGQFVTDMLSATSMTGKSETTTTGSSTQTTEFGKFNKGTINWFSNRDNPWHSGPGQRLLLSLSNSGENYEVYGDMKIDNWVSGGWDGTIMQLLSAGNADWWLKGTAGIFDASLGTAGYGGFVSTQATWNDWLGWNNLCRFGVWRAAGPDDGFLVGGDFRTWVQWGAIAALGVGLGDNFKFSLGYRINPHPNWDSGYTPNDDDPTASMSSINGSFMFNGRVSDAIAFDLFYSIMGRDDDTFGRPRTIAASDLGPIIPSGSGIPYGTADVGQWGNIIGAYIGLNVVENLGLSIGYTANFDVYETTEFLPTGSTDWSNAKERKFIAPFYSGIDIHLSYSGIDKIGLTFNNNISLAGVKATKLEDNGDWTEIVLDFDGGVMNLGTGDSWSKDWFHWNTELKASLGFIEGVGLTLHLGNQLGMKTDNASGSGYTSKSTATENEFRVSLFADHGIGAVTVGAGIDFGIRSKAYESEISGGGSTTTVKANSDVTYFSIPILFRVAF
jgi:hypothetical protein